MLEAPPVECRGLFTATRVSASLIGPQAIQDPTHGLQRTLLPRAPVNKGKNKGRGLGGRTRPPSLRRAASRPRRAARLRTGERGLVGAPSPPHWAGLRAQGAGRAPWPARSSRRRTPRSQRARG